MPEHPIELFEVSDDPTSTGQLQQPGFDGRCPVEEFRMIIVHPPHRGAQTTGTDAGSRCPGSDARRGGLTVGASA